MAGSHQLYLNDGAGNFTHAHDALPAITVSGSCIRASDFDGDGDLDLFIAGRLKKGGYPFSPRSYVLRNDSGKFTDVTDHVNSSLREPGMLSDALWADINNDGRPDLIIVGEWQPIRIFRNDGGILTEISVDAGLAKTDGWWNCIGAGDLNGDGFVDFVIGNTGKNSYFHSSVDQPVQIVAKDFDHNGSVDPVVTYFNPVDHERYMVHNRLVLIDQIPHMKKRFETFESYATMPFGKVFAEEELEGAFVGSAHKLESVVLINNNGVRFSMSDLPDIAQLSVMNDVVIDDINRDGFADIVAVGNMYGQETLFGRYDASLGTVLLGDGNLHWEVVPSSVSGFVADGDARCVESLRTTEGNVLVVINHNDSIQFFRRAIDDIWAYDASARPFMQMVSR